MSTKLPGSCYILTNKRQASLFCSEVIMDLALCIYWIYNTNFSAKCIYVNIVAIYFELLSEIHNITATQLSANYVYVPHYIH